MAIYDFNKSGIFLKSWISNRPKKGRGESLRIAKEIGVHPTLMSLILKGERILTLEQAESVTVAINLTNSEKDYLIDLVQYERAGTPGLKKYYHSKIQETREKQNKTVNRFAHEKQLTSSEQEIYYSSWIFSAIRLYSMTKEKGVTVDELAARLGVDLNVIKKSIEFLTETDLISEKNGRYSSETKRTFLQKNSHQISRHHLNWRLKAMQNLDKMSEEEMMFTSPISVSREDFSRIRSDILSLLEKLSATVKNSPAEDIACINVDFFWV